MFTMFNIFIFMYNIIDDIFNYLFMLCKALLRENINSTSVIH